MLIARIVPLVSRPSSVLVRCVCHTLVHPQGVTHVIAVKQDSKVLDRKVSTRSGRVYRRWLPAASMREE